MRRERKRGKKTGEAMQPEIPPSDFRPNVLVEEKNVYLAGMRCSSCGYPLAYWRPRCPVCRGPLQEAFFGPRGVVWSSTIVYVPIAGRVPPYGLAYVDLDNGPRILAHLVTATEPLAVGTRVSLVLREGDHEVYVEELR